MKIAICFSGMIRTGVYASKFIKNYIGNLYDSVDFFMHTWDITQSKKWNQESLKFSELQVFNNIEVNSTYKIIKDFTDCYDTKFLKIKIENFSNWNLTHLSKFTNFSPLWYSWQESISLKREIEIKSSIQYDYIIKMRPDVIYPEERSLEDDIEYIKDKPSVFFTMGYSPARVDDVFFICRSGIMDVASTFYSNTLCRDWVNDPFGLFLRNLNIECQNTRDPRYAVMRDESIFEEKFNKIFNIDRDYFAPANTSRLPI